MPRAQVAGCLRSSFPLINTGATARVRRPALTTLPQAIDPRSHLTVPTAPSDRRRPYNLRLQLTVTRLLMGASRPQARACS